MRKETERERKRGRNKREKERKRKKERERKRGRNKREGREKKTKGDKNMLLNSQVSFHRLAKKTSGEPCMRLTTLSLRGSMFFVSQFSALYSTCERTHLLNHPINQKWYVHVIILHGLPCRLDGLHLKHQ